MSLRALNRFGGDSFGQLGVITSITLNLKAGEAINLWLTIVISVLSIVYMTIKIAKEIKNKK